MTIPELSNLAPGSPAATILVVEDEPLLRFTLAMELNQAGLRVREAASVDEAETVLAAGARIDLIVTDIELAGSRSGLELAQAVRSLHPHIRVIVVSANTPEPDITGIADAFFGKPYDINRLIQRIRDLLGQELQHSAGWRQTPIL
ncbi:response regulator [Hyphomicrobium sp.]|uniref:response regulator n=1 Tax=Hyphomicrobium sp. TaxID=82 RepID=UPI002FDEC5CE